MKHGDDVLRDHSGLRFLIVDDFPTMRRILSGFLNDAGFTHVMEADDGDTALAILRRGEVDFLITDWNMPRLHGRELIATVRADPDLATLPILLVTAESTRDHLGEALEAGADGCVTKPFLAQTLKDKLAEILARSARR
jgi:two-component system chemotaxis response regulator CheY